MTAAHAPNTFASVVRALLGVPRLEGTFRIRAGDQDVTDAYSELRFKDPRLGGYLDRTRVTRDLAARPLTVWLRGPWSVHATALNSGAAAPDSAELDRNCWTLLIPPRAIATVSSPRRAFAVVRRVVGQFDDAGAPQAGRTLAVRAGAGGLIAQLDWLNETAATHLNRGFGIDLSHPVRSWHEAPVEAVLTEVADRIHAPGIRTD